MPTTLILVPDIYYRNWDLSPRGTGGEMWLCLRPMLATGTKSDVNPLGDRIGDFFAWTSAPDTTRDRSGAKLYDIKSPHALGLGSQPCGPAQVYMPINLPSGIDVHIKIGRRDAQGQELPEIPVDLMRSVACKAVPGAMEGEDALGTFDAGKALPFAAMFNADVKERFGKLLLATPPETAKLAQAAFAFHQQMEYGRRIRFSENQIRDGYHGPEIDPPVLARSAADTIVTSVYWFMGLMVRLGTQADLASLRQIDRVDIHLTDDGPDEYGFVPFPDSLGGHESAYEYFQKVGVDFAHTLTTELIDHDKRLYTGPGFRGFQRVDPPLDPATTLWVTEGASTQHGAAVDRGDHGGLARLAAIELRSALKQGDGGADGTQPELTDIGTSLTVMPGLYVTGTLKRYRRFPDVSGKAKDPCCPTVMTFEPDPAMAVELAKLRDIWGDDGLRTRLTGNAGSWNLTLLHGGVLPWDGPQPVYRMLATPVDAATTDGSLVCQETSASFFIKALPGALAMTPLADKRHIWDPRTWGGPGSPKALAEQWKAHAGDAWEKVRANALQVTGLTKPDATAVHTMMIDEFDFIAAESPLRLEKILAVTALSPRMAAIAAAGPLAPDDKRNFDPLRDYEDDFINLNSVRVWRPDSSVPSGESPLEEALLRPPQRSEAQPVECRVEGEQRRQTIPILHAWPPDPLASEEFVSLEGNYARKTFVTWQMVRDAIARRHDLLDETDKGPYRIDLEHTYGDRLGVMAGTVPLRFGRSARRSWPVQLPTFVEAKQQGAEATLFIKCRFVPGGSGGDQVELTFDTSFLSFPDLSIDDARSDKRYAIAVAAWRSLAELASPGAALNLHIQQATFDLLTALKRPGDPAPSADPAEIAAREGFVGGWARGIDKGKSIDIIGGPDLDAIRSWALGWIKGTAAPGKFMVKLGATDKPGDNAHLARVDLELVRKPDVAPVPASQQVLAPTAQQPALFRIGEDTMLGQWSRLGFGVDLPAIDATVAGTIWQQLQNARDAWIAERKGYTDSVTPPKPDPLPAPPPEGTTDPHLAERKTREVQAALIAALEGSDWFAPQGAGPRTAQLAVRPIHVPVGFAPCRPHVTLKQQTQNALERLMTALRDTIDLSYAAWVKPGTDWQAHFAAIAALARDASPHQAQGLLQTIADLLIGRLLVAEPDGSDPGNQTEVCELATALGGAGVLPSGDFKWFADAVRRKLLSDPAMFTDAKALLLTAVNFVEDKTLPLQPPAGALARARFNRRGLDQANPQEPATSIVTLDNLVFAGKSDGLPLGKRLAFLETLDDSRYGDSFEVPAAGDPKAPLDYVIDSYEELVDPRGKQGGWPQRPAFLPLAAANDGRIGRIVHLASRALVSPPLLRWSGESDSLDAALAGAATDWSVEQLEKGLPGMSGAGGARLRIAGIYRNAASPATVERGVSFILYRVTGDEEGRSGFEKSFANDSFFVRLRESDYGRSPQPDAVSDKGGDLGCELLLRALLLNNPGSDAAADAIRDLALGNADYSADLAALVATGKAQLPDPDFALIRLTGQTGAWKLELGGTGASGTLNIIRHAALFKPDGASNDDAARTGYLLVGFETNVWAPIEAELRHGRNVPQDRWIGATGGPGAPRFAPQFWQSVTQDAPTSRHSLAQRVRTNKAAYWRVRPSHVVKLDAAWRKPITPRALLDKLLFEVGHAVGTADRDAEIVLDRRLLQPGVLGDTVTSAILSPASRARIFDQQLSIQIAHEQFGEEPTPYAEPLGNFPLEANMLITRKPASEPSATAWFDPFYDQFSVSLRWFAPSGTSLLTMERIFVEFA